MALAAAARRGRHLRRPAVVALCALALAAPGCGGDDGELPGDIDGVCREVAQRFAEIQTLPPSSWESAEERTAALLEIAQRGDAALVELAPQASDPDAYQAYLAERARVSERLAQALDAIRDRRAAPYDAARAAANDGALKRRALAEKAALPGCASVAGA